MKKFLFYTVFFLAGLQAKATIHTIVTDGLNFIPQHVAASVGDTIEFDLGPAFTATEVSATTWNLNGNTPLVQQGSFDLERPGMIVMTHEGYRYYVCKWHHTTGMKGSIQVLGPNGVRDVLPQLQATIYPIPTQNNLFLNILGTDNTEVIMDIFDDKGQKVLDLGGKQVLSFGVKPIDVAMLPAGVYYLNIQVNSTIRSMRFVKL